MNWYPWIVLVHVLAAFGFVLAHGASVFVALRLRNERDRVRVAALLDVSGASLALLYIALLVLVVAGIAAGIIGGHFGRLWIWVALGVLAVIITAMYVIATPYYGNVRKAVGAESAQKPKAGEPPPELASPEQLAALLDSSRAYLLAVIGGIGLVIIVWLMMAKPF